MNLFSQLASWFGTHNDAASPQGYRRISAQETRDLLRDDARAKLVDVRTEWEYRQRHIATSILIPDQVIVQRAAKLLPDQQAPIIVHCQSGVRSRKVAKQLLKLGYTQVYDLGGITNWPYGTVSG